MRRRVAVAALLLTVTACGGEDARDAPAEAQPSPTQASTAAAGYCGGKAEALTIRDRLRDGSDLPADVIEPLRRIQLSLELAEDELEGSGELDPGDGKRNASDYVAEARRHLSGEGDVPDFARGAGIDSTDMGVQALDNLEENTPDPSSGCP